MSTKLEIKIRSETSKQQIQNCLTMMENFRKFSHCFDALFGYLLNPNSVLNELTKASISNIEFADFLVNYFSKFDLLDISIGHSPESKPVFEALHINEFDLPNRFSTVNKEKCTCIGQTLSLFDLNKKEETVFDVDGQPLAAYSFSDDCVGCFYESEGKVLFRMFNGDNDASAEVSLENAAMFFISPRKIALVQSTEMFASAIYLEIPEGDEEDDE